MPLLHSFLKGHSEPVLFSIGDVSGILDEARELSVGDFGKTDLVGLELNLSTRIARVTGRSYGIGASVDQDKSYPLERVANEEQEGE